MHGADLVSKCKAHNFFRRYGMGLVCIERPGYALVEEDTAADMYVLVSAWYLSWLESAINVMSQWPLCMCGCSCACAIAGKVSS